jgi:dolichyldiphosphatase
MRVGTSFVMDDPPLASLSLTHVHYDPNDLVSYGCAYLALVPQGLVIVYAALIWSTREIEILLMFAGQMACEALNFLVKRGMKEERPSSMCISSSKYRAKTDQGLMFPYNIEIHGTGYGMPSSHAQFVAYFSAFLTLFLLFRHDPIQHPRASSTHVPIPYWQRLMLALTSMVCAGAVAQSRIYLHYHTPRQVYVGVGVGVACAFTWFIATGLARRYGLVECLLEQPLARWARLRDLVVNEDLVDAGWERWETRRRKRSEGKTTNGTLKRKTR